MAWSPRTDGFVNYRNASGRVFHAVITGPGTLADQLNLRVGNGSTKLVVTDAPKVSPNTTGAGWYRFGGG